MARYIGNYEVVRQIGEGHFGTVYLGVGEVPARGSAPARNRLVAIKRLKKDASEVQAELLRQEFSLLEQTKHRSIVRVFEYVEDEHAVVMEHIHGVSLRELFDQLEQSHEQVFTEAAVEIGCEIADALHYAYTTPGDNGEPLQLVHRDLKPANIMLTPKGEVKILDFGLARVANDDFAPDDSSRLKGSLLYMAPEQAKGLEVDHRTDLFALGLILYELLTGDAAYASAIEGDDPLEAALQAIEAGDLSGPCGELEARLPGVGPVVARALLPRPQDRYQDGHGVLVDLKRQLYRDRGAYLKEFCDFFFEALHDIGDAPTLESTGAKGRPRSAGPKRMSIQERLRQSMEREAEAKQEQGTRTSQGRGRTSTRGPNMASNSDDSRDKGRNVRPPVGGGASRSPNIQQTRGKSLKELGKRAPDETGMLEMQSMVDDQDELDVQGDPSATQFFAIPAPKAERAGPTAAPPPPPAGIGGPGGRPPAAPYAAPGQPMPQQGPTGVGGAPPAPTQPMIQGPMVQGPVAGYGGGAAGGGGTPFNVNTGAPVAPSADAGQRVQSNRVYAVILGVFLLVCMAMVAARWLATSGEEAETVVSDSVSSSSSSDITGSSSGSTKKTTASEDEDTGLAAEPAPRRTSSRSTSSSSSGTRSSSSGSSSSSGGSSSSAASPGTLIVRIEDPTKSTSLEVICAASGFRERAPFSGGVATVRNVPSSACEMHFKGPTPAKFGPVGGGRSMTCRFVGTTADCK